MTALPVVCSIGTSDPWNAAGLGLDVRVLAECGVRPVTVVAGISAQGARGIEALHAVEPELIAAQWRSLERANIAAVRVGALVGVPAVRTVAGLLRNARVPVVYDPVFSASAGGRFVAPADVAAIRDELLGVVTICTPNLAEAAELAALVVTVRTEMVAAAQSIRARGAQAVLVTGGHLSGDPCDVLVDAGGETEYSSPRLGTSMRGSGCVLAAALSAALARGLSLREAVVTARRFVQTKIAGAVSAGDMFLAY